jgi:hypothetical protein
MATIRVPAPALRTLASLHAALDGIVEIEALLAQIHLPLRGLSRDRLRALAGELRTLLVELLSARDHLFETTAIERTTLDDYAVAGDLTIRGITRRTVLDVSRSEVIVDQTGKKRVGFVIGGALSRKDFGLTWNFVLETGGVMVGDKVTLDVELQAILSV